MGIPLPVIYFAEDKYGNLQVIDVRSELKEDYLRLNKKFDRLT